MILDEHLQFLSGNRSDLYTRCQTDSELTPEIYTEINKSLTNANNKQIYNINTGALENNPNYNPEDPTNP